MEVEELEYVGAARGLGIIRTPRMLAILRDALGTSRGRVGAVLLGVVLLIAIAGPLVAPKSATAFGTSPFGSPSSSLPLGGDVLGRDVLSRLLDGGWQILLMGAVATVLAVALGAILGVVAAYQRGAADTLVMRSVDVLLAFPSVVLALLLVSVAGPNIELLTVAVVIAQAPQVARVVHSAALDVCEREYVSAARLMGEPSWKVMAGEIVPNLTSVLMVETGLRLTYSIIIISGLSFLGFGLQPPAPNWGTMINENRGGLASNVWPVVGPAVMLVLLTVGTNTLTDAIARVSLGLEDRGRRRRRSFRLRLPGSRDD
jgi:peptide/nickel transport system permease protein